MSPCGPPRAPRLEPRLACAWLIAALTFCCCPAFAEEVTAYWWHRYPTYSGDARIAPGIGARWADGGYACDPTWGPYGQFVTTLDSESRASFTEGKAAGLRRNTYMEGYGQCQLYVLAFERGPDGAFPVHEDDADVARGERQAWNWEDSGHKRGNTFRWVGLHNTVNSEDFAMPRFSMERLGLSAPCYPDGRQAVGWTGAGTYPLNARVYDANCAKDINGDLAIELFRTPKAANEKDPATGEPKGDIAGLYPFVPGKNYASYARRFSDKGEGEPVYAAGVYLHKDIAAPFWVDAVRVSMREILKHDIDSMWCDNFSIWDNFSAWPVRTGFGDWSEALFKRFLEERFSRDALSEMGIDDFDAFGIRAYLKRQALAFGAKDPSYYWDEAWRDTRWLDDPVWNAYKVFKQKVGQEGLRNYYAAVHDEAAQAGRPDFCLAGNDMPACLGWVHEDWLDMASFETGPGWSILGGPRGFLIPPMGKMAVLYRAALEHQKGPYATTWYYLHDPYDEQRERPGIGSVLAAEAFATGTFMKFGGNPAYPGTEESHRWWNSFVTTHEQEFGRRHVAADVGILYSPDNQLGLIAPGGVPSQHRQPHTFGHWGFATAMIDGHIPYRAVMDWKLTPSFLKPFRTFVIPYALWLDDDVVPVLETWVREGGRLVVTGPSGTREGTQGFFRARRGAVLSPLVGCALDGESRAEGMETSGQTVYAVQDPFTAIAVTDDAGAPQESSQEDAAPQVHTRAAGKGTVVWTSFPVGMEYFLKEKERGARLDQMLSLVGDSVLLDAKDLPSTVGAFCWQSPDGQTRFVDLVNYNIDTETDTITPAQDLRFRMRMPDECAGVTATALSPDGEAVVSAAQEDGWAVIQVDRLAHFVSVKLVAR